MRTVKLVLLTAILVLAIPSGLAAADWHGIVPLRSTRSDVEKSLGKPNAKYGRYNIADEQATIMYSNGRCSRGWDVPEDTVINIMVTYHGIRRLSDLGIDVKNFERFADPLAVNHISYSDPENGIRYVVAEGTGEGSGAILYVVYGPTKKDLKLRCQSEKSPNSSTQRSSPSYFFDQNGPRHRVNADIDGQKRARFIGVWSNPSMRLFHMSFLLLRDH